MRAIGGRHQLVMQTAGQVLAFGLHLAVMGLSLLDCQGRQMRKSVKHLLFFIAEGAGGAKVQEHHPYAIHIGAQADDRTRSDLLAFDESRVPAG